MIYSVKVEGLKRRRHDTLAVIATYITGALAFSAPA